MDSIKILKEEMNNLTGVGQFEKISRELAERRGRGQEVRLKAKSVRAFLAKTWKQDKTLRTAYRKSSKKIGLARDPGELRATFLADLGVSSDSAAGRGIPFGEFGRTFYATPEVAKKLGLEPREKAMKAYHAAAKARSKYEIK